MADPRCDDGNGDDDVTREYAIVLEDDDDSSAIPRRMARGTSEFTAEHTAPIIVTRN